MAQQKDLGKIATEHYIFFLVRGGQEKKKKKNKSFLVQQKDLGESGNEHYIFFPRSAFFCVVWTLVGVCSVFEKNSRYEFRNSCVGFPDFSLFLCRFQKVSKKSQINGLGSKELSSVGSKILCP